MFLLTIGLLIFLGMHSAQIFANGARENAIERIGKLGWMAAYSLISFFGLYLIIIGYDSARQSASIVYETTSATTPISHILMAIALILLVSAYLPLGNFKRAAGGHPMITAVILWAVAHLLVNGSLADVLLFGSFFAWAALDRISMATRPPPASLSAEPNVLNDIAAILIGTGLYIAALVGVHEWLVGVSAL